jgi:peptide chain release factor 1
MDIEELKQNYKTSYLAGEYERISKELEELLSLDDPEMLELVEAEKQVLIEQKNTLEAQLKKLGEEGKSQKEKPTTLIMEFQAGTGGDEASLFAGDLVTMYQNYCAAKGYSMVTLDTSVSEAGGYKEASFELKGKTIFDDFKFETGLNGVI